MRTLQLSPKMEQVREDYFKYASAKYRYMLAQDTEDALKSARLSKVNSAKELREVNPRAFYWLQTNQLIGVAYEYCEWGRLEKEIQGFNNRKQRLPTTEPYFNNTASLSL